MRIAILGHSGSGKSTLAKQLGEHYGIPVLHLDSVNFESGWVMKDRDKARAEVLSFMEQNDSWVIDGNYGGFYREERLERADRIVYLNFPRHICLLRAFNRYLHYRGQTRPDMADGCREKFDFEFFRWIMWEGRSKSKMQSCADICRKYADKTLVFQNPKQLAKWIKTL